MKPQTFNSGPNARKLTISGRSVSTLPISRGFRFQGLRFRVQGLGFQGLGFTVQGLGLHQRP